PRGADRNPLAPERGRDAGQSLGLRHDPLGCRIVVLATGRIAAEVLRRGPDGAWPEQPELLGPGDELSLDSIGFAAPLKAAYRTSGIASQRLTARPPTPATAAIAAPRRCGRPPCRHARPPARAGARREWLRPAAVPIRAARCACCPGPRRMSAAPA